MKKRHVWINILILLVIIGFSSCASTKYVPENSYLLDKTEITVEGNVVNGSSLTPYLRQRPNFKVFHAFRLYLGAYNLSGRDTSKKINRKLKEIGEAPVIYDPFQTYRSEKELQKYMKAKGYMQAEVTSSVSFKKKKATVHYNIKPNDPYVVRNITYDFDCDPELDTVLQIKGMNQTKLKTGMIFDTDVLDQERERICDFLKRRGYYYFTKEYLSYSADSSVGQNKVDLTLHLKPFSQNTSNGYTEETKHKKYKINQISVTTLKNSQTEINPSLKYDTLHYTPTLSIISEGKPLLRPSVIEDCLRLYTGMSYNEFLVNRTYTRLNTLGIIRTSNIRFKDLRNNKNELDCDILLLPAKPQSFSFDVEGTNSSGDLGFALNLGYQHKNIFRGSEILSAKLRYAQEAYSGLSDILDRYILDFGGEITLNFPRFMFPFVTKSFKRKINANTEYKLQYNYQIRPNTYERTSAATGMKYIWNMRRYYRYTFDLIDLNYIKINTNPSFDSIYSADKYSVLRESYSDHFIMSCRFTIMYDNQTRKTDVNKVYYRFSFESAGNLLYGINNILGSPKNVDNQYEIGNIPYSQYLKGEYDYSFNQYLDTKNRFVYHIGLGIAYPYGNAEMVPFEKRFFGGGANGVRGWSVRTLGPGNYSSDNYDDFVKQSGDINLLLNFEYRAKLIWKMESAIFIDAGNIWTIKEYESQPNGQFLLNSFYKQIALSYGLGLRFDFSYFLLRFDMGVKAFNPSLTGNERWRFKGLNWDDDFAIHFAIGYPF